MGKLDDVRTQRDLPARRQRRQPRRRLGLDVAGEEDSRAARAVLHPDDERHVVLAPRAKRLVGPKHPAGEIPDLEAVARGHRAHRRPDPRKLLEQLADRV